MPQTFLGPFAGEWFEVSTPEQARLLSDPAALRHLEPFIGRTLGTAQAAHAAGVSTEGMMYRVKQFVAAGLLTQVGTEARKGRPIRLYRAPSGLRVPFHLTPFANLEAQINRHSRHYELLRAKAASRSMMRLPDHARLIYRDAEHGTVHSESEFPPGTREEQLGGDYMGVVWLTDQDARALQDQLDALLHMLSQPEKRAEGTKPFLVQSVLLRVDPQDLLAFNAPPN